MRNCPFSTARNGPGRTDEQRPALPLHNTLESNSCSITSAGIPSCTPHSHTACTILFEEKAAHARLRISRHNCERGIAYSEVKNESEGSLSYFWRGSVPGNVSAYRANDRSPHQQAVDR